MTIPDLGFGASRAVRNAPRADTAGRETPIRSDAAARDDQSSTRVQVTTPEFAALLALLGSAGVVTRTSRQLPSSLAPTVSLLDRAIDDAVLADGGEPATISGMSGSATAVSTQASTHAATDRLRYGLLAESAAGTDMAAASTVLVGHASPTASARAQSMSSGEPAGSVDRADPPGTIGDARRTARREVTRAMVDAMMAQSSTDDTRTDSTVSTIEALLAARDGSGIRGGMDGRIDRSLRGSAARTSIDAPLARSEGARTRRGDRDDRLDALLATRDAGNSTDIRATLDALLAHAGTSLGAQIADAAHSAAARAALSNAASGTGADANRSSNAHGVAGRDVDHTHTAGAAHALTPLRDPSMLDPDFRARLDRVLSRMQSEFGHEVQVVETMRSQDRQDYLFAQGRTRTGDVVTWTRDSAHTRGAAADVVVDGSWNNPEGFARLQRIAREEGLRTLGSRDPGHLELPSDGQRAPTRVIGAQSPASRDPNVLSVASAAETSARAAGVAGVASVASVAQIASATDTAAVREQPTTYTAAALRAPDVGHHATGDNFTRGEFSSTDRRASRRHATPVDAEPGTGTFAPTNTAGVSTAATQAPAIAPAGSTDRVADVHQMRDDAPAVAMSRMSLDVDGVDGLPQRITVDLRGNVVDTHITTDATSADVMRRHTGELTEALERRGLESDSVRISATGRSMADVERVAASERGELRLMSAPTLSSGDGSAQQRERASSGREWERHDDARRARDEQRDAQRDERQSQGQRGRRSTTNQDAS